MKGYRFDYNASTWVLSEDCFAQIPDRVKHLYAMPELGEGDAEFLESMGIRWSCDTVEDGSGQPTT